MRHLREKYESSSVQIKATFWFLICSMLQKGISVIVTPIFTRLMTTEQYGLVNVYTSWRDIFAILITLRLADGVMGPGLIKEEKDKKGFSSSIQGLSLTLVCCGAVIFATLHTPLERITGLSGLILCMMIVQMWAQSVYQLWAKEQRINLKYRGLVLLTIAVAVIRPALGIWVVTHTEDKTTARIVEMTVVDFVAYIGLFIYTLYKGKRFYSKTNWKYALSFNTPLIPHFLSQTVLNSADRIMIERMVNADASGIYSLAYQISVMTVLFNNALLQAMSPWTFNKLKSRDEKAISSVGFTALALIAVINLLFIAFAPELVALFAPSQYREAIWIIPPITMSVFFQFSYLLFTDIELYYEKTKSIAVATTAGALLNLLLNYIFIRIYGYFAAGYTTLACYIIIAVIHYIEMKKISREALDGYVVYPLRMWLLLSGLFLLIGFVLLASYSISWLRYAVLAAIALICLIERRRIAKLVSAIRKKPDETNKGGMQE